LIVRRNQIDVLDFSVILGWEMPSLMRVFRLQRCNGRSHEHLNPLEGGEPFFDFHVHTATERYQLHGSNEEHYAERTGGLHGPTRSDPAPAGELLVRGSNTGDAAVTLAELAHDFSAAVGAEVRVEPLGARDARVFVPFEFPDGDRLVIRLREIGDAGYELTDVGHTLMHLSYEVDMDALESGNRKILLEAIEQRTGIEERSGELVLPTRADVVAGDLFQFVQALLQISDLRFSLAGARQIDVRRRPTRPVVRALWRACALRLLRCTTRPRAAIPDRLPAQQPSETTRHLRRRERRPGERRNDHVAPVP
jgi:Domain of unknown function DUF1828